MPPLGLYIHFPWCVKKCPYCDFNSHTTEALPEAAYIDALLADFEQDKSYWQNRTLSSIFMGGGTPSLFSAQAIETLLNQLCQRLAFSADIEITLEANPGTFEENKFAGFYQAGVNRLSVGVQSFADKQLQKLGRIHNAASARSAISRAQQAGFNNINIDLMHGLPEQSLSAAMTDLQQAIDLKPSQISWYQLTIEPNTIFYSQPPPLPEDDLLWHIQHQGQQLLAQHDYQQYEVSAYSQQQPCRHNLNYWQFGDYLALGAGAHGKITCPDQQQVLRYRKTRLPKDYLNTQKKFTATCAPIAKEDLAFEFFLNGLRLNQGIEKQRFTAYTGLSLDMINTKLEQAITQQLLEETLTHWRPTEKGRWFLNDLQAIFLAAA